MALFGEIVEKKVGSWNVKLSDRKEGFGFAEESKRILREWRHVFPKEETWIQSNFGVPSFIVRIDCTVDDHGLHVYEIEDRPSGIGVTMTVNPEFKNKFENLVLPSLPHFKILMSENRKGNLGDDCIWADIVAENEVSGDELLLVRSEPEEEEYHRFQKRSVSTLKTEGDKSYGLPFGWWKEVAVNDFSSLPWGEGFALKPLQGSKCRDVLIYSPNKDNRGRATRTKIADTLERHGKMYLQRFFSPMCEGEWLKIYRAFFAYDPKSNDYFFVGGVWNARKKQLRIHGSPDAVFGPLI